jgi:hypothetical protein
MLLVNGDKLRQLKVIKSGDFALWMYNTPDTILTVAGDVKLKLGPDQLFILKHAVAENGDPIVIVDPLQSSLRKFQKDYLFMQFIKKFDIDDDSKVIKNLKELE